MTLQRFVHKLLISKLPVSQCGGQTDLFAVFIFRGIEKMVDYVYVRVCVCKRGGLWKGLRDLPSQPCSPFACK